VVSHYHYMSLNRLVLTIVTLEFILYIFIERFLKYTFERLDIKDKIIRLIYHKLEFGAYKY
jgi:hypothetical protein